MRFKMQPVTNLNLFLYLIFFLLFRIESAISIRSIEKKISLNSFENELDYELVDVSNEIDENEPDVHFKKRNKSKNAVTESPIDTLLAITRAPVHLVHTLLIGNETSKHAREIGDIIGYNLKKIVRKFFKIANEALDNFNAINNAGLVSAIIQVANFMTKVNQFVSPTEWQATLMNFDLVKNIRIPLNLRSPNANREQFFDLDDL